MTISTLTTKNAYNGNGSNTTFAYGFYIPASTDIQVIVRSAAGTETVKSEGTGSANYSITGVGGASGGNVIFVTAPANTETVTLRRATALTQGTDYVANDPFPAETHESALDKLTIIGQDLQEQVDRSLKLSRTNTMTSTDFTTSATDRASKILAFDSSGELSVTQELGTVKGNWAASTAYVVRDIVKDTNTNNIFICLTAHTSSGSVPLTTNTDAAKWSLLVDAASSTTSQTAAAASATASANSATASAASASTASGHKDTATTKASEASTSAATATTKASEATTARNAAVVAQTAAEAALDTFDDRFLGAKSSNPSVDNDGNALIDGALFFDTTNDIMKVYDLTNTQWRQLTLTSTNQGHVNTVSGIQAAVTGVNNISGAVSSVNSNATNVNLVAGDITNVNQLAGALSLETTFVVTVVNPGSGNVFAIDGTNAPTLTLDRGATYIFNQSDNTNSGHPLAFKDGSGNSYTTGVTVTGTAGSSGAKVTIVVAANAPSSLRYYCTSHGNGMGNTISVINNNLTTVASNITNVNLTGGSIANVNLTGGSISNVNTVASNLSGVNSFAARYRVGSSDPGSDNDEGDLIYNSTSNALKYFNGSSFVSVTAPDVTYADATALSIALG